MQNIKSRPGKERAWNYSGAPKLQASAKIVGAVGPFEGGAGSWGR